ncbi:MAG: hypothetical protein DI536_16790 [Archangium gephyra]|uniref:Lipoprotein n=1 Tax=Archangium gephyra TaxID=48 RepID=A0A2W5VNI1_9BACT|nr:MAG: hypothetical protein DI536_16790 [Archangium gephyra]
MRASALLVVVAFAGCTSVSPARRVPDAALGAVAPHYGATNVGDPLSAQLYAKVSGKAAGLLRYEAGLAPVATSVGRLTAENGVLPATSVLQWLFWRAGVVGAPLQTRVRAFSAPGDAQLEAELQTWADELSKDVTRPTAFAIATFDGKAGGVALVTADDEVRLTELARDVAPGAQLELRGSLTVTGETLELLVADDDRQVRALEVPVDANGGFSVKFTAPTSPGLRFVELLGNSPDARTHISNRRSLALFPLSVGTAVPDALPEWVTSPKPNPSRRDQFAEGLMRAYAEERRRLGLTAPLSDSRLEPLAAQLAGMRGVSGMRGDENLAEFLASRGLVSREAWARFSAADTLDELVQETLLRPSWRRVLLSDQVYIAPVLAQQEGRVMAWEVVVVSMPALDANAESQKLLSTLAQKRRELGGPPLEQVASVQPLLQAFVDAACRDDADDLELQNLARELQARGIRGGLMGNAVHRASVNDGPLPEEFVDLLTTKYPRVAVATCQAEGPGLQWSAVLVGDFQ